MSTPESARLQALTEEIDRLRERLSELDGERVEVESTLSRLQHELDVIIRHKTASQIFLDAPVTRKSSLATKQALIRRLFRGREDVYPVRWENAKVVISIIKSVAFT